MNLKRITNVLALLLAITAGSTLKAQNNCNCWQTVDTNNGWHVVPFAGDSPPLYRNDDDYTNAIMLPFKFCYWGHIMDSLFINNNGNISFGVPIPTYSPQHFPIPGDSMIAPFWGDVDTRDPGSGVVYYKLTPTYLIVQWDTVGYFNSHSDKLNSFQVIISDGKDPIIPNGNNVEFCYHLMQWTTGDASFGINGFDGNPPDPATVGANDGDGVRFVQFGLFGVPGNSYLGQYPPFPYDGVGWLNYKTFMFNTCNKNVPPIVSGVTPCDTLILCMGDTLRYPIKFLASDSTDTIKSALWPPVLSGVSIIANFPGNTDSLTLQIIANGSNYGFHTIKLYGYTSNENPHDTTFTQFVLEVDSNANGKIVPAGDTICKGDSVKLKAVTNTNNYLWSNGKTTDSIEVAPVVTTTYTLHTAKGKCPLDLSVTVVVVNGITGNFTPSPNPQCTGMSVTFTNNTVGANRYRWNFGDPASGPANDTSDLMNPAHTYDTAGTYTVTLIASNSGGSCNVDTIRENVTIVKPPKPVITGNDSICIGASTILTANAGFTSYNWSSGATTSSINVNPVIQTTYTVTVSNGACTHDTTFTVSIKPLPVPGITARPDSICAGDSATLTGSGGGTYAWSVPPGGTNQTVKVVAGTYTLAVTKDGCTRDTTITIIPLSNTIPGIGLTRNNICPNDSTTLKATGGKSYKWMPGGSTDSTITVDPGTTTTYTCQITTPCRIIDTTITVTYHRWPRDSVYGDTSLCKGNTGILFASGGGTYMWSNGQTSSSIIVAPARDSVFTVQVTLNGCTKDTSIKINVHNKPNVSITPGNRICAGKPFTISATGACNYLWSNGATTSSITVTPGITTTYTVKAWCFNDTTGCDTTIGSTITVDAARLNACCDTTIASGDTANLSGSGSNIYFWTPDFGLSCNNCPNPIATPTVTVSYTVSTVDTLNGCATDTIITVKVTRPCNKLYVPNVFTPNNDGINDDFVVSVDTLTPTGERSSWSNFTFYNIVIFDRWGKEVFTSTDPNQPWNGRVLNTNNLVPEGVYYYIIKTTCGKSDNEQKGFVHVLGEK